MSKEKLLRHMANRLASGTYWLVTDNGRDWLYTPFPPSPADWVSIEQYHLTPQPTSPATIEKVG